MKGAKTLILCMIAIYVGLLYFSSPNLWPRGAPIHVDAFGSIALCLIALIALVYAAHLFCEFRSDDSSFISMAMMMEDDDLIDDGVSISKRHLQLLTAQTDKEKQAALELRMQKDKQDLKVNGTGRKSRSDFEKMYSGYQRRAI